MPWTTYILHSATRDRYYIGQTSDLKKRLQNHAAHETKSTKFADDWMLVFSESFETLQAAMAMERKIKGTKSRKSIQRYIADSRNETREPVPIAEPAW